MLYHFYETFTYARGGSTCMCMWAAQCLIYRSHVVFIQIPVAATTTNQQWHIQFFFFASAPFRPVNAPVCVLNRRLIGEQWKETTKSRWASIGQNSIFSSCHQPIPFHRYMHCPYAIVFFSFEPANTVLFPKVCFKISWLQLNYVFQSRLVRDSLKKSGIKNRSSKKASFWEA